MSTSSFLFKAACVQVIAIIFASLTSKYFDLSNPDLNNSNALNSSSSSKILWMYLKQLSAMCKSSSRDLPLNRGFGAFSKNLWNGNSFDICSEDGG